MSIIVTVESPEFGQLVWTLPRTHADLEERLKEKFRNDPDMKDRVDESNCVEIMARTSLGNCARALLAALEDVARRDVGIAIRTLDRGVAKVVRDVENEIP